MLRRRSGSDQKMLSSVDLPAVNFVLGGKGGSLKLSIAGCGLLTRHPVQEASEAFCRPQCHRGLVESIEVAFGEDGACNCRVQALVSPALAAHSGVSQRSSAPRCSEVVSWAEASSHCSLAAPRRQVQVLTPWGLRSCTL